MFFSMFIPFGVDFASRICRFTLCINYGKISASTEIFFFPVPYKSIHIY